jgi:hypothetical protein
MREAVTDQRLRTFMRALAAETEADGRVYFTGGASAVVRGWRASTVDVDLKLVPDSDAILRALPTLKERLQINVELAAPSDFVPELPGWQERSVFIARERNLDFFHYDFYSQALAKLERGHRKDRDDVAAMVRDQLVDRGRLLKLFNDVEPMLFRYPAIDAAALRRVIADVAAATNR